MAFTTPIPAASALAMAVVAGGPAGEHSASGVSKEDKIIAVTFGRVGSQGELLTTDLTGEFVIPDDVNNVVRNRGGTDSSQGTLIINFLRDGKRIFANVVEARAARS
jgi:hypothetical protein